MPWLQLYVVGIDVSIRAPTRFDGSRFMVYDQWFIINHPERSGWRAETISLSIVRGKPNSHWKPTFSCVTSAWMQLSKPLNGELMFRGYSSTGRLHRRGDVNIQMTRLFNGQSSGTITSFTTMGAARCVHSKRKSGDVGNKDLVQLQPLARPTLRFAFTCRARQCSLVGKRKQKVFV
jgi:hypothetical protein